MKTVNLAWVLPTTRVDGAALAVDEIAYSTVEIGVVPADGGTPLFAELAKVNAPETALIVPDLAPGSYAFRITVTDKQKTPKTSAPAIAGVDVPEPELAAPGAVTGITVTLS